MLRNSYYLFFVTSTTIDHMTILAIYPYDNTSCRPENGLEGIVVAGSLELLGH